MPEPDCFLRHRIGYGTLQPCLGCQRAALLRGILRRENPTYTYWRRAARASRAFKWFYLLSRRNTFVGGKCALASALLVSINLLSTVKILRLKTNVNMSHTNVNIQIFFLIF